MTKKLTISVSEELAEQLEPFKDRMNLSKIFAEAAGRELGTIKAAARMEKEIARHKKEAMNEGREGYITGLGLAKELSFVELDKILTEIEKLERNPEWVQEKALGEDEHPTDKLPGVAMYKFRVARLPEISMSIAVAAWERVLLQSLGSGTSQQKGIVTRFKDGSTKFKEGFRMALSGFYHAAVQEIQYDGPPRKQTR